MVQLRWLWTMCFVTSGLLTVQSLQLHDLLSVKQLNSSEKKAFFLPMKITNRVFNSKLLNTASEEYKIVYKEVTDLLDSIYDCSDNSVCPTKGFYGGVAGVTFSSGSVIANSTLVFDTSSINTAIVHILFLQNANNVEPKTLQLNLDYTTTDKIKSDKLETPTTPMTTTTTPTKTTTTPTTPMTTTTTPIKLLQHQQHL
ncbi:integumentary mucin C.1-like [Hippoglossus hippoglossus]|uniref:integumentary mucin C.1-like n=1 Tax=Hippoglossus hippoglossus TaxID=8267 RepID=UPI00148E2AE7|nr:integumentary mucin C.1-like [Hippoglossus hippoglossus]